MSWTSLSSRKCTTRGQQHANEMESAQCAVLPRTGDVQSTAGEFDSIHGSGLHSFCDLHIMGHVWGKNGSKMSIGTEWYTCLSVFNSFTANHGQLKLANVACRNSFNVVVVTRMKVREPMLDFCKRVNKLINVPLLEARYGSKTKEGILRATWRLNRIVSPS